MPDIHPTSLYRLLSRGFGIWVGLLFGLSLIETAAAQQPTFDELLSKLPPLKHHVEGTGVVTPGASAAAYEDFAREKLSGKWFAALLPNTPPQSYSIVRRFETW